MKYKSTLEYKDARAQLAKRQLELIGLAESEARDMTEAEQQEYRDNAAEIDLLDTESRELEAQLEREAETQKETRKIQPTTMEKKNLSIVKEIRSAMENGTRHFTVNADTEMRTVTVQGYNDGVADVDGVHDNVVETELQGILEPLYAKSVLTQLGVKWYTGMPMGDISVPVMGKGNVGWAAEIAAATASGNTFSNIVLQPKRLTAYVDISKQLIAQDTIGVENAIRRDIVNALNDKLEATILGTAAGDATKPAGIFYNAEMNYAVDSFAEICDLEAGVEAENVYGQMKYLLSPSAKAAMRAMAKSTKHTQLVFEGGEVDGVPAITTSNVPAGKFIYGDFSNLAVASWGAIDITVDEYTQAVNGCVRLVINAYFDAKKLRSEAFAFADINAEPEQGATTQAPTTTAP